MAFRVAPNLTNTISRRFDFEIRLVYRGDEVLPLDPEDPEYNEDYRCRFELEKRTGDGDWSTVEADTEIPKEDADESYRVLTHDNHAIRSTDALSLCGDGGDTKSKPDYYDDRSWVRDVKPAVPLRVEVRIKVGETYVEVEPDQVWIGWQLLDPEEDVAPLADQMAAERPRTWIRDFFKSFKRDSGNASSHEDDNCSDQFGGVRPRDDKVRPSGVLFQSPFAPPGEALEQQDDDDFARSSVVPDEEDATKGVSDVFFYPPPVGGDNYRFVLTVRNRAGRALRFKDSGGNELTEYRTGIVTLWRKVSIDLLVTFQGITPSSVVVWDEVKDAYRAGHIELVTPTEAKTTSYGESVWKEVLRDYFRNDLTYPDDDVIDNDDHYRFAEYLLPQFPAASLPSSEVEGGHPKSTWIKAQTKAVAKKFLHRAYGEREDLPDARTDTAQDNAPGLFGFLCRKDHERGSLLGSYLGDREFLFVASTTADPTKTITHEMGHGLFMRHSTVSFHRPTNTTNDLANRFWLDHDQGDAVPCVMSYSNYFHGTTPHPVRWHFCGACILKLRFWDMVLLQANSAYQEMIYKEWKDILVKHKSSSSPVTYSDIPSGGIDLRRSGSGELYLVALSAEEPTLNYSGGPWRKNLTSMRGGEWISSDPSLASFHTHGGHYKGLLRPAGTGSGSVDVHFKIGDVVSRTVRINVRD